jgi:transposase InsO family protein
MIRGFKDRVAINELCKWADVAKSSFHYKAHSGERGKKASTHTPIGDGLVENELVVDQMRAILSMDYCVYGYQMMTAELRSMEYVINKKKVYRLMKEHRLLSSKVIKTQGKREWVKFRRIEAKRAMEYLCLDIKYIWVHGENRWYYQLAIMDVFSRRILCWIFQRSVKQNDVIALMRYLDLRFGLKGVIIRNDNGSQFIAHAVRQALRELEACQEFTHVATPEENAYIEAFHSIEQRELIDRFKFLSFYDAKKHIEKYMHWYNCKRKHGALNGLTPMQKWTQGFSCSLVKQQFEPALVDLSRPDRSVSMCAESAAYSLDKSNETAYLRLNGEQECQELVANLFRKNVQLIGG